jgi:predicted nucleotide-binding protein (sugar kinase/HSP70/actin superfamily)
MKKMSKKRILTSPHIGYGSLALHHLMYDTNLLEIKRDKETLNLGVRYAPEYACFPFKILLGDYIKAFKKGATTIVTSGGFGPCRAGYYGPLHKKILEDLGYDVELIMLENFEGFKKLKELRGVSWFRFTKILRDANLRMKLICDVEQKINNIRPHTKQYKKLYDIESAFFTRKNIFMNNSDIINLTKKTINELDNIPVDNKQLLRIGLIGEIFVLLDNFTNFEIEKRLHLMNVETDRSVVLRKWIQQFVFLKKIKFNTKFNRLSDNYLKYRIGGDAKDNVSHIINYAKNNYDGIIQLSPFSCIPEIVVKSILPTLSVKFKIPILSLNIDEQTGIAGMQTRLESFIDILAYNKKYKNR